VVSEEGREALPAVDVEGDFVVGSAGDARIRLPEGGRVEVRAADVGAGRTYELGRYRVRVEPAPVGAIAASPQRTESLARELVRAMLGANAAPTLEIERGKLAGAKRALAPPESVLVIGRGDEAGWIVDDGDLSRAHAEIRRGWDGVRVHDLGSKNGTRVGGARVADVELRDGDVLEFGKLAMRFCDPADRRLREPAAAPARTRPVFYIAVAVAAVAIAGLVWILSS
jgi:hypothetical protein